FKWRTAWNPSVEKFELNLKPGEKRHIKLEWVPDGGVSYIGLKVLTPTDVYDPAQITFSSEMGDEMRYFFMYDESIDGVISQYRTLTGKAQVMPKWSMGFWQSRERYKTQKELLDVLAEFREREIPIDNIVLDWSYLPVDKWGSHEFDLERFPDAAGMIEEVHENDARIMVSVWPKFYINTEHYNEFNEQGWMYQQAVKDSIRDWIWPGYIGSFYDAYQPGARKLFWEQIREHLYTKGFDAWWLDATEPDILSNASISYRKELMNPTALGPATQYFNAYALMNAKGIYEGQREEDPDDRVFILTRSGFAGIQRYGAVTWSGDIGTRWEDMRAQITAGLNFAMTGLPYWTMDIGGFCVEKRYEVAVEGSADMEEWRELNTRWYQFGSFVPLFRVHGQYPFREIWNIAPEGHPAYNSMLKYNKLRYRLMPYTYSLAGWVHERDYTIMRGLAMDFPADREVWDIADQYMFGPNIMVCPVGEYQARDREVYLPESEGWYDGITGAFFEGGQTINADAPYEFIPLFIPAGAILPFGPEIQ
ncbi:MAG: glycoside hydrolase family 31 protein, partial [Cyclobacteriaceae bacterium]